MTDGNGQLSSNVVPLPLACGLDAIMVRVSFDETLWHVALLPLSFRNALLLWIICRAPF